MRWGRAQHSHGFPHYLIVAGCRFCNDGPRLVLGLIICPISISPSLTTPPSEGWCSNTWACGDRSQYSSQVYLQTHICVAQRLFLSSRFQASSPDMQYKLRCNGDIGCTHESLDRAWPCDPPDGPHIPRGSNQRPVADAIGENCIFHMFFENFFSV